METEAVAAVHAVGISFTCIDKEVFFQIISKCRLDLQEHRERVISRWCWEKCVKDPAGTTTTTLIQLSLGHLGRRLGQEKMQHRGAKHGATREP